MFYPETRTQQVLRLLLAIHTARLWSPLPDPPALDLREWFDAIDPSMWAGDVRLPVGTVGSSPALREGEDDPAGMTCPHRSPYIGPHRTPYTIDALSTLRCGWWMAQ